MSAVALRHQRETEETARALAEKVSEATVEHLKHKFEQDMKVLRDRIPNQQTAAKEAAMDAKYLANRQANLA